MKEVQVSTGSIERQSLIRLTLTIFALYNITRSLCSSPKADSFYLWISSNFNALWSCSREPVMERCSAAAPSLGVNSCLEVDASAYHRFHKDVWRSSESFSGVMNQGSHWSLGYVVGARVWVHTSREEIVNERSVTTRISACIENSPASTVWSSSSTNPEPLLCLGLLARSPDLADRPHAFTRRAFYPWHRLSSTSWLTYTDISYILHFTTINRTWVMKAVVVYVEHDASIDKLSITTS